MLYSYIFYPSPLHVRLHSLHVTLIPSVGRPTTYKLAVICHSSLWRGLRLINACGGAIFALPLLNNFIHSFLGPNHARGCKVVSRRPHLRVAGDRPSPTPSITNLQPWTFTMPLRVRIRKRVNEWKQHPQSFHEGVGSQLDTRLVCNVLGHARSRQGPFRSLGALGPQKPQDPVLRPRHWLIEDAVYKLVGDREGFSGGDCVGLSPARGQ